MILYLRTNLLSLKITFCLGICSTHFTQNRANCYGSAIQLLLRHQRDGLHVPSLREHVEGRGLREFVAACG